MQNFPFVTPLQAMVALRVLTAAIFVSHAGVRLANGTFERFAAFLSAKGIPWASVAVGLLTLYELVGGLLLLVGVYTRWLALGFFAIIALGIVLVHAGNGWFVGEHGTGGMEYSVLLLAVLVVLVSRDKATTASS